MKCGMMVWVKIYIRQCEHARPDMSLKMAPLWNRRVEQCNVREGVSGLGGHEELEVLFICSDQEVSIVTPSL